MNWLEIVNKASTYIEHHITEDIDLHELAKHCNVSYSYFAKVFPMITGYPIKEYIRNRRMTLASYEVSNTDQRIIDIAVKYCYSSNEAFSRAFKQTHGMNPSEARKRKIKTFVHFPSVMYDIPKTDVFQLEYEELGAQTFRFIGVTHDVVEEGDIFRQRRDIDTAQQAFADAIGETDMYGTNRIIYKIKTDIDSYHKAYQLTFGLDADEHDLPGYDTVTIDHHKYLKYTGTGESLASIRTLKTMIIDEWNDIDYDFVPVCEIEYVEKMMNGLYRLTYIISVK